MNVKGTVGEREREYGCQRLSQGDTHFKAHSGTERKMRCKKQTKKVEQK